MHRTRILAGVQRLLDICLLGLFGVSILLVAYTLYIAWRFDVWDSFEFHKTLGMACTLTAAAAYMRWGHLLPKGALISINLDPR